MHNVLKDEYDVLCQGKSVEGESGFKAHAALYRLLVRAQVFKPDHLKVIARASYRTLHMASAVAPLPSIPSEPRRA